MTMQDGPTSMLRFLQKVHFTKPKFGLFASLGVNRMWTKRNDPGNRLIDVSLLSLHIIHSIISKGQLTPWTMVQLPCSDFSKKPFHKASRLFASLGVNQMQTKRNDGRGETKPVHLFLGGRFAVVQQRTIVWVGLPYPRNDRAPKNERARFFNICPKRAVFKNKSKFDHFLVFSCLCLSPLLPQKNFIRVSF